MGNMRTRLYGGSVKNSRQRPRYWVSGLRLSLRNCHTTLAYMLGTSRLEILPWTRLCHYKIESGDLVSICSVSKINLTPRISASRSHSRIPNEDGCEDEEGARYAILFRGFPESCCACTVLLYRLPSRNYVHALFIFSRVSQINESS